MARPEPVKFIPKNPEKYNGTYPIWLRSSWEVIFAKKCDLMDDVVKWSSEPHKIPYTDPTRITENGKTKQSIYIPDFLVTLRDSKGSFKTILVEIKPKHESGVNEAKNVADSMSIIRNQAKWAAASWWCQRRGIQFAVLTEDNLFNTGKTPPPPIAPRTQPKLKVNLSKKGTSLKKKSIKKRTTNSTSGVKKTRNTMRPTRPTAPSRRVTKRTNRKRR
jgi:hypothetical protein